MRFFLMIVLLLSGCTTMEPLDMDEEIGVVYLQKEVIENSKDNIIERPITLYEAMARAIVFNLDEEVERRETEYRNLLKKLSETGIWPTLVGSVNSGIRNNDAGSRSRSLLSGRESLEPSTSAERDSQSADLTLSLDILESAISYIASKEAEAETYIAHERHRKVLNRIIEDVRTAYWRAVSAERTFEKLLELESLAEEALFQAYELENTRKVTLLPTLSYQRDLIKVKADVQRIQEELIISKYQLAALMNLPPNIRYKLEIPTRTEVVPMLPASVDQLVKTALYYRSEMRELLYTENINDEKLERAFYESLPTFRTVFGANYDTNEFLFNQQWYNFSANVSWDLLSVFKYPIKKRAIFAERRVIEARKRALIMAVMTQVHVARAKFVRKAQELRAIKQGNDVQSRILALIDARHEAKLVGQQTLVKEKLNYILSEINYDSSYADMQNSYANLYAAMGLDNYGFEINSNMSVDELAQKLKEHWEERAVVLPKIR
ncbi:MAG: transporter [Gammaproteobacteria bacterium]|nr:transporter [Gammaproteobacteria bacterium]HBF08584.1 transporter [Gammaproteobacteria bacterium]